MTLIEPKTIADSDSFEIKEKVDHSDLEDNQYNKLDSKNEIYVDIQKEMVEIESEADVAEANRPSWQKMFILPLTPKHMVWMLGGFASAAGLLSGLDQSIISGASIGIKNSLDVTTTQMSLVSSLMPLGAVAGSIMMTPISEYFGRKWAIIVSCIWYTVGAISCAAAQSHHLLYAGRFMLGVGVGIEGGCVSVYLSESVPPEVRGNIVSMYQFNIALGEVFGFVVCAIFFHVHGGWRYMVGSSLVFSTLLLVGMLYLPESPRYLVYKGHTGEAYNVWKRLRDCSVERNKLEFIEMKHAAIREREFRKEESTVQIAVELFSIARNRRALIYSVIMVSLGQLTGINAVMYYLSSMMARLGFNEEKSVYLSLVGGGSLLLGSIPGILYMDRFGRRKFAQLIIGFSIGLVFIVIGYSVVDNNLSVGIGLYFTGIVLYMGFFGAYACLTWVIPAESFAIATRSVGMTICSSFLYLWAFTVTYNFSGMAKAFTYQGLCGFYLGIGVIGLVYQILFMPETKNKTLEEIDDIFNQSPFAIARHNFNNLKKGII